MLRLTHERKLRGWTQRELAERSGVNATTVNLVENGRYLPGPLPLAKIARALGLNASAGQRLLERIDYDPLQVGR
jgi:transcriptional regulator with XRE-family HTH domain